MDLNTAKSNAQQSSLDPHSIACIDTEVNALLSSAVGKNVIRIYEKVVKSEDECKEACLKSKLCTAMTFLRKTKSCTLRLCKLKTEKAALVPADKTFKLCSKKPCLGE